jgi:hypothetical protein
MSECVWEPDRPGAGAEWDRDHRGGQCGGVAPGFPAGLIVEKLVIVELKSVERVTPAHKEQVLTYLRLTGLKLGYLLNFGEALKREGITRIIHGTRNPVAPCLGASVREPFIELGGPPNASPPRR